MEMTPERWAKVARDQSAFERILGEIRARGGADEEQRKVLDAIETALHLPQGELNLEREVLNDYGNMSAPTVMFVLERLVERGLPDRTMMTAFGPGFTCAGLLLEAPGLAA